MLVCDWFTKAIVKVDEIQHTPWGMVYKIGDSFRNPLHVRELTQEEASEYRKHNL